MSNLIDEQKFKGLELIARVVREARGNLSYRHFGEKIGISHTTIQRLEGKGPGVQEPKDEILQKLAPYTSYSYEDLKAMARGLYTGLKIKKDTEDFKPKTATELFTYVDALNDLEAGKLAAYIIQSRLIKDGID